MDLSGAKVPVFHELATLRLDKPSEYLSVNGDVAFISYRDFDNNPRWFTVWNFKQQKYTSFYLTAKQLPDIVVSRVRLSPQGP